MRTCTHSLPTFLAPPSNFLSLPSTQFLSNNLLWRLTVHPWLLASCLLTSVSVESYCLEKSCLQWRNLSVWSRKSIMFFSILQVDRLLRRSTHLINWNTIVHASSSATSLGSLAPNHQTSLEPWPFALTCVGFSMLLFQLIKFLPHFVYFGLNLSPSARRGQWKCLLNPQ